MKYIPVPAPVTICDIEGNPLAFNGSSTEQVTFDKFVLARLTDPRFAATMQSVVAAVAIRDAVKAISGGYLALEDDHYAMLKEATEAPARASPSAPAAAYPPGLAHNLVSFMKAVVLEAVDEIPQP